MSATALPAFLDALQWALVGRSGLAGVRVFTCPVDVLDLGEEAIEFAEATSIEQTTAAMGSTDISEIITVNGSIICYAEMPTGADVVSTINDAAKTVRDRACAILEEVTDQLASDRTVSDSVLGAEITSVNLKQGMAPEGQLGRVCHIEFTIKAEAHTTP